MSLNQAIKHGKEKRNDRRKFKNPKVLKYKTKKQELRAKGDQ